MKLTREQFERLKQKLAAKKQIPEQSTPLKALQAAGYSCWLELMMYQLALVIDLDD